MERFRTEEAHDPPDIHDLNMHIDAFVRNAYALKMALPNDSHQEERLERCIQTETRLMKRTLQEARTRAPRPLAFPRRFEDDDGNLPGIDIAPQELFPLAAST
jgi:hypothetical protein